MYRITTNMMATTLKRNLNRNMQALDKLEEQISSGRKINRPSDDPAGLVKSLRLRSDITQNDQYVDNISDSISFMDTTDSALDNLSSVISRIRELTVQGANGTNDQDALNSISEEMRQLKEQIRTVANTTYGSKYIFAGSNVTQAPCSGNQWTGNEKLLEREIGAGVKIPVNLNMKSWFIQQGTSTSGEGAATDISAWSATPPPSFQIQVDGDPTLHTVTLDPVGPPPLDSGANIAAAMKTAINAIVESGYDYAGVDVAFDAVNNSYSISSGNTGITSGIEITAGTSNDVSAALKLGITNDGTEAQGIFAVIDQVVNAVDSGDSDTVSSLLSKVDEKLNSLLSYRSVVGAKTNRMEMQQSRLESTGTSYTGLLAQNEDADMAEVAMNLKMQENVYNASLAGGAQVIQPTLIDFLK